MAIVQDIISKAMDELKSEDLKEYHKEFKERHHEIQTIMKSAAEKETELNKVTMRYMDKDVSGMLKEITRIIGPARVQILQDAFLAETFTMTLEKKRDDCLQVVMTKNGQLYKERVLLSREDSGSHSIIFQGFSIIVEGVMLLLSAVGINQTIEERPMNKLFSEVEPVLRGNAVQEAMKAFTEAWNQEGATVWQRAKALFLLIKNSYAAGIFWKIIKFLICSMDLFEIIRTIAEIAATLVAALASDGAALIARIILALNNAASFFQKCVNLQQLTAREQSLGFS